MKTKSISFQSLRTRNEARFSFTALLFAALVLPATHVSAEWNPAAVSPYSFGPEGRPIGDIVQFAKPNQMVDFLPNRPIAARDKYGNRVYFSGDGHMTVSISRDGTMSFSMKGKTIEKDANGNLVRTKQNVKGTNKVEIRNEKGEILGFQTLGFNDKVLQEFDAQGNLTKTNTYNIYGKAIQIAIDELSLTRTEFDKNGNPVCDRDFEGAVVARYSLDEAKRVQAKKDVYGNVTHFGKDGNMTHTENKHGQRLAEYHYKIDEEGRNILDYVEDVSPGEYSGDRTYFQNGKSAYTVSRLGGIAKEYHYDGTTLVYTFDTRTNETTWYDINGKSLCSTFNEYKTKEWLYYKSRLVGFYDDTAKTVTLFQYERQDQIVRVFKEEDKPNAEDIESYFESRGLMAAIGEPAIDTGSGRKAALRFTNIVSADNAGLKKTDFTTVFEAPAPESSDRFGLVQAKNTYADGKLQSILTRDPQDGNGFTTRIFIGEVTSGQDTRTSITVTGDQRANAELFNKLWDTIVNGSANIADISAGNVELSALARTIKSVDITAPVLGALSDSQICNLFGWNRDGSYTSQALEDVRARISNAGKDGTVSTVFSFNDEGRGNRIYAAAVSAITTDRFLVAGTIPGTRLDLTTPLAHDSIISPDAAIPERFIGNNTAPDDRSNPLVQTVNGVTRTYKDNGNILLEVDNNTGLRTEFDAFNRRSKEYNADGLLVASYFYGSDGKLQTAKTWDQEAGWVTSFFVGWGTAMQDQTQITVAGDQVNNTQMAQELWDALNKGINIADISSGKAEPGLTSFASAVRSVQVSPVVMSRINDQQLCTMLGWDMAAPDTRGYLDQIREMKPGLEGMYIISYGNASSDTPIYASRVESINITRSVLSDIDVSSVANHDRVVAPGYTTNPVTQSLNNGYSSAAQSAGLGLLYDLSDKISLYSGSLLR